LADDPHTHRHPRMIAMINQLLGDAIWDLANVNFKNFEDSISRPLFTIQVKFLEGKMTYIPPLSSFMEAVPKLLDSFEACLKSLKSLEVVTLDSLPYNFIRGVGEHEFEPFKASVRNHIQDQVSQLQSFLYSLAIFEAPLKLTKEEYLGAQRPSLIMFRSEIEKTLSFERMVKSGYLFYF
jgi:hypothetical protein